MGAYLEAGATPTLFHGTDKALAVGDVIVPQGRSGYQMFAYATDDAEAARYFGDNVYEVTPVGMVWCDRMDQYDDEPDMLEYVSDDGFTVVKLVSG